MILNRKAAVTLMGVTVLVIFLVYAFTSLSIGSVFDFTGIDLEDVCLDDPRYPLCETSEVTDEEMIEYLFKEIYQNSQSNSDIPYCEYYFFSQYHNDCENSLLGLPEGLTEFDLELISLNDNQYFFYIINQSDIFRVDVTLGVAWDVVKFETFTIVEMKSLSELGYSEDEAIDIVDSAFVRSYGIVVINSMDTSYCESVYTFLALDDCLKEKSSFNYDVLGDFEIISELSNHGYLIKLSNWYSTDEVIYEVYFEEVDNELKISQLMVYEENISVLGRLSETTLRNLTSDMFFEFMESITIINGETTLYNTAADQCAIYASDNLDFDCAMHFSAIEGYSIHSVGIDPIALTKTFIGEIFVEDHNST